MSNKTILPSSFLAPINYYSILFNVPNCIIDINEFYIKQTLRSRYAVYASNGKLNLSIPRIRKNSSKTLMKDIQICYSEPWQKIHWKTITSCYNSSPFFDFYRDKFEEIFQRKDKYLLDLNNHSLLLIVHKDWFPIATLSYTVVAVLPFPYNACRPKATFFAPVQVLLEAA